MGFDFPHCTRCRVTVAPGQNIVFREDGRVEHVQCPAVVCPACQRPILLGQSMRRSGGELLHGSCWIKRRRAALALVTDEPTTMILAKLKLGVLPRLAITRTRVGPGTDRACSGCDVAILPSETQQEVEVDGTTLRFHRGCLEIWQREVARLRGLSGGSAPSAWTLLLDGGMTQEIALTDAFGEARFEASVSRAASRALRRRSLALLEEASAAGLRLRACFFVAASVMNRTQKEHREPRQPLVLL